MLRAMDSFTTTPLPLVPGQNITGRPLETSTTSWATVNGQVPFGLESVMPPPCRRMTGRMLYNLLVSTLWPAVSRMTSPVATLVVDRIRTVSAESKIAKSAKIFQDHDMCKCKKCDLQD